MRSAQAIRARIASADDDYVLARREDLPFHRITRDAPVLLRQKIHREMNPAQIRALNLNLARLLRADRDYSTALLADLRDGSLGGVEMWRLMHSAVNAVGRIDSERIDPKFAAMIQELNELAEPPTD